jgi:hypothetical protein
MATDMCVAIVRLFSSSHFVEPVDFAARSQFERRVSILVGSIE